MTDSLSEFALHPFHALSAYCSEKQLLVYDNDCKYNLFKCSFVTQVDKQLSPPHSPLEDPAPSVSSVPSVPSETSLFTFSMALTQRAPHHQAAFSTGAARPFLPQPSDPVGARFAPRAALPRFLHASNRANSNLCYACCSCHTCYACYACYACGASDDPSSRVWAVLAERQLGRCGSLGPIRRLQVPHSGRISWLSP